MPNFNVNDVSHHIAPRNVNASIGCRTKKLVHPICEYIIYKLDHLKYMRMPIVSVDDEYVFIDMLQME